MIRRLALKLAAIRLLYPAVAVAFAKNFLQHKKRLGSRYSGDLVQCEADCLCPRVTEPAFGKAHLLASSALETTDLTVLLSVKGGEEFLQPYFENLSRAVEGVRAEVAVILESPSAAALEIVRSELSRFPNFRLYVASGSTLYAAWNLALRAARSEFVSNLNVDDIRAPGSYSEQLDLMRQQPGASVIYSNYLVADKYIEAWGAGVTQESMVEVAGASLESLVIGGKNPVHASPIWKRSMHEQHGYFNAKFLSSGDTEFWLRLLLADEIFLRDKEARFCFLRRDDSLSSSHVGSGRFEWAIALQEHANKIGKILASR
jgi:hypothetical protein